MVLAITVKSNITNTLSMFKNLPMNVRKEIGDGMFKIAKSHQRGLRFQLNRTSKRFDYKIYSGIRAEKLSNVRSVVKMPQEGVWLDSMKPHAVQLKRGRRIHAWAMAKGSSRVKEIAMRQGMITVRAKPFIEAGLMRGRKNNDKILQHSLDVAIKNSRK